MRFAFTELEIEFQDLVRGFLARYDAARLAGQDRGDLAETWSGLAHVGLLGALVPEQDGGSAVGYAALALGLDECGYAGVAGPVLESACIGAAALRHAREVDLSTPRRALAHGTLVISAQTHVNPLAVDADRAHLVVQASDGGRVNLLSGPLSVDRVQPAIDGPYRVFHIRGGAESLPLVDVSPSLIDAHASLGAAGILNGIARRLLDLTVQYVGEREQFGRPVGSFQAIKHRLADLVVELRRSQAVAAYAATAFDKELSDRFEAASLAKGIASAMSQEMSKSALQMHGAIGFTAEYRLGHWLKYELVMRNAYGTSHHHFAKVGAKLIEGVKRGPMFGLS